MDVFLKACHPSSCKRAIRANAANSHTKGCSQAGVSGWLPENELLESRVVGSSFCYAERATQGNPQVSELAFA
jgi:hypothetical protein